MFEGVGVGTKVKKTRQADRGTKEEGRKGGTNTKFRSYSDLPSFLGLRAATYIRYFILKFRNQIQNIESGFCYISHTTFISVWNNEARLRNASTSIVYQTL